jgi:hypothetical protein
MLRTLALAVVVLVPIAGRADGAKRYKIEAPAAQAKVGAKSTATLRIVASEGSHVSDEAPLKIALKGDGVKLDKELLHTADIADGRGASPRFDLPITGDRKGDATITAEMTFIVCTKELCEREQEQVTIPVRVQ